MMFATTAVAGPCDPWAAKLVSIQGEATVNETVKPSGFPLALIKWSVWVTPLESAKIAASVYCWPVRG